MSQTINDFLQSVDLDRYAAQLVDDGYELASDLCGVSVNELVDSGVKKGHARRIVNKIHVEFGSDEKEAEGNDQPVYHGPKKTVSLLLYGQTGVGKSTLLKSLYDYICGVPFDNLTMTPKPQDRGASQTQTSSLENMNNIEWDVNIIDTPGIGDTQGCSVDEQHMNNITDYLDDKEFNAVCILIKRGETRSVNLLRYVINELRANLPKEVAHNFIVIMTRAEVPIPDADTMAVIEGLGLPVDNIIPVNNIAYEEMDLGKWTPGSALYESVRARQRMSFFDNQGSLQRLLELAYSMPVYHGSSVVDLKRKRNKLREQVGLLKSKLDFMAKQSIKMNEQRALLARAQNDARLARSAIDKTETYEEVEYVREGGTIHTHCNVCSVDCHMDCGLGWNADLTGCYAMSGSSCRFCHHSVTNHAHKGWKEKKTRKTRPYRDQAKLAEMNEAERNAAIIRDRQRQIQRQQRENEREQTRLVEQIRHSYNELEEIAILGWNDSYENYMLECTEAIKDDPQLAPDEKKAKLSLFQNVLAQIQVLKDAVGL